MEEGRGERVKQERVSFRESERVEEIRSRGGNFDMGIWHTEEVLWIWKVDGGDSTNKDED